MRRCADRKRETAEKRHAAIETHQLHRDLALVVVHRQHGVESAAFSAKENGVRRERPFGEDTLPLASLHRRADHVDLLAPEIAAVARVWLQPNHRNPTTPKTNATPPATT